MPANASDLRSPMTQELLNQHVLEVHPDTAGYPAVVDYAGMKGYGEGAGGRYTRSRGGGGVVGR